MNGWILQVAQGEGPHLADERALVKSVKSGALTPYTYVADATAPERFVRAGTVAELEPLFAKHSGKLLGYFRQGKSLEDIVSETQRSALLWKLSTITLLVLIAVIAVATFLNFILYALFAAGVAAIAIGLIWLSLRRRHTAQE